MATFKELEKMLSKYKWYLEKLNLIELSIRYPESRIRIENVGGGKSNVRDNDSMLRTIIRLDEKTELQEYKLIGLAIERTYARLNSDQQKAFMEFYINRKGPFRGHPKRTAAKINVDESTLYRWRRNVITVYFDEELEEYYEFKKSCTTLHEFD